MELEHLTIEKRCDISRALERYLRSRDALEKASMEFQRACDEVREQFPRGHRFVLSPIVGPHASQTYLCEMDDQGDFDVDKIEVI